MTDWRTLPRPYRRKDITGQRFGALVALRFEPKEHWVCKCDCGRETLVKGNNLRRGITNSCGKCNHRRISASNKMTEHGHAKIRTQGSVTAVYKVWEDFRFRCNNKDAKGYLGDRFDYDPRWDVFEVFLADIGERPSECHIFTRRDFDFGYWPDNCFWEEVGNARSRQMKWFHANKNAEWKIS